MSGRAAILRSIPYFALIAAAAYFFLLADRLDFDSTPGRLGPDAWPKGILVLMVVTCLFGIVRVHRRRGGAEPGEGEQGPLPFDVRSTDTIVDEPSQTWLHLPILGSLFFIVYVVVLDYAGFVLATAALVASFLYLGRYRDHRVIAICSVAAPLVFFFIFRTVAYVSLPLGRGPFLDFSVWLMKILGMS